MKIIIEEIISQEFEVQDGTTFEEVREAYRKGELVVEDGCLQCASVLMNDGESWRGL